MARVLVLASRDRLLQIAVGYGYPALVLGTWGCGAFGNDPARISLDFRRHLEDNAFEHVVFSITDRRPTSLSERNARVEIERGTLGTFRIDRVDGLVTMRMRIAWSK